MDPVAEPTEEHAGERETGGPPSAEQALRAALEEQRMVAEFGQEALRGRPHGVALDRRTAPLHLGLDPTAERLRLSGGDLEIESEAGSGTVVRLAIPLDYI